MCLTLQKVILASLAVIGLALGSLPQASAAEPVKVQFHITNDLGDRAEVWMKYVTTDDKVKSLGETVAVNAGGKLIIDTPPDVAFRKEGNVTKYLVIIRAQRKGTPNLWWGCDKDPEMGPDVNKFKGLPFQVVDKEVDGKTVRYLMFSLKPPAP